MIATAKQKTEVWLDDYFKQGFHIERRLFTNAECNEIKEAAKTLDAYKNGTYEQTMFPHRLHPVLTRAIKNPKLVLIMEKLVGGKVDAIHSQFFFGKPGNLGFTAHQDNYFVEAPNDAFASAWLALDEINRENGTIAVYPESHKLGVLKVQETGSELPHRRIETILEDKKHQPIDVIAKPGDVVFIHANILHSSYDNTSKDRFRHVMLMTYVRQGAPFRSGYHAKREVFNVYE